jgi:methionyl-tRNA formyltransferase
MRIAFLFNYALVDNRPWKQTLIGELAAGGNELYVLFGKNRIQDYVKGYLRRRSEIDVGERVRNTGEASAARRTVSLLRELGVPYDTVASVNSEAARDKLRAFAPDYVVTALDQVLSRKTLETAPLFLNAHYGVLPHVKGWNATEWSLLLRRELTVSLHRVAPGVDTGEIYLTRPVAVSSRDTLEGLRGKCQEVALGMYRDFFAAPERHISAPLPNEGGETYYAMNREMKKLVAGLVRAGRIS